MKYRKTMNYGNTLTRSVNLRDKKKSGHLTSLPLLLSIKNLNKSLI